MSIWIGAFVVLVIIDFIWFYASIDSLYRPVLKKIQKSVISIRIWSAIVVWMLLSLLIAAHIFWHPCPYRAGFAGVFYGFVIYGVYNFTNHATLYNYPLSLAIIDTLWGAFAMGTTTLAIAFLVARFETR